MRGAYTYTVRRTLLIKRQEPLRKYWTDISCFGGKVWISVECCGLADDRDNTIPIGILTKPFLDFAEGNTKFP